MIALTLKDLAIKKINLSISNRCKILDLYNKLPWVLVLELWGKWFQQNWEELLKHKPHNNPYSQINFKTFKKTLSHKTQLDLFANIDYYR